MPNAEVWTFGSRANGLAHDTSDLDLVLVNPADPTLPTAGLAALAASFSDSNLPTCVDVVDWARLPDHMRREIGRAYVVVHPSPFSAQSLCFCVSVVIGS